MQESLILKNINPTVLLRILDKFRDSKIDVIVPIYNAYDELCQCIESLIKYRNCYDIILVNDCSNDSRINNLLAQLDENYDFIKIINNASNIGNINSVNLGMRSSNNDIILLNSDTVVTPGWANKIRHCAYLDGNIATVTPLTNNGTICSIPKFLENNDIPQGFSIDSFGEFIEKISLRKYPEIPTAVGFCMYIKRKIIEDVGYYDNLTYGRGYCAENDFCMRCINKGYKNVLCDDTFIFHKGGVSFLGVKNNIYQENLSENMKILLNRYPDYMNIVRQFCESNPLKEIHENINFHLSH